MNTPIDIPADQFKTAEDYGLISYIKPAIWIYILEVSFGRDQVDKAFQNYFNQWKNKHPQPEDMKISFEKSLGVKLDQYFKLLRKEGGFL